MAAIIVPAGLSRGPYQISGLTSGGGGESTVLIDAVCHSGSLTSSGNGVTTYSPGGGVVINVGSGANGTPFETRPLPPIDKLIEEFALPPTKPSRSTARLLAQAAADYQMALLLLLND